MSYPNEFVKLSFGGTLADGNEIWSCGLSLCETAGGTTAADLLDSIDTVADELSLILEDYIHSDYTFVPSDVKLKWMKLAPIGTDGKYTGPSSDYELDGQGLRDWTHLPQAAIVNGLMSAKWKDPGKNNRFYLPVALNPSANIWQLGTSDQANYAATLAAFVDSINELLDLPSPLVKSKVCVTSNSGTGSILPVTSVRIGRIVDTQRRRRNQLSESYVEVPVGSA